MDKAGPEIAYSLGANAVIRTSRDASSCELPKVSTASPQTPGVFDQFSWNFTGQSTEVIGGWVL